MAIGGSSSFFYDGLVVKLLYANIGKTEIDLSECDLLDYSIGMLRFVTLQDKQLFRDILFALGAQQVSVRLAVVPSHVLLRWAPFRLRVAKIPIRKLSVTVVSARPWLDEFSKRRNLYACRARDHACM